MNIDCTYEAKSSIRLAGTFLSINDIIKVSISFKRESSSHINQYVEHIFL